jgi:hypothetical protein
MGKALHATFLPDVLGRHGFFSSFQVSIKPNLRFSKVSTFHDIFAQNIQDFNQTTSITSHNLIKNPMMIQQWFNLLIPIK